MRLVMVILAGFLTACYLPLCVRVTMVLNDAVVSARSDNWVMAELIFHGLALALLWTSIITR